MFFFPWGFVEVTCRSDGLSVSQHCTYRFLQPSLSLACLLMCPSFQMHYTQQVWAPATRSPCSRFSMYRPQNTQLSLIMELPSLSPQWLPADCQTTSPSSSQASQPGLRTVPRCELFHMNVPGCLLPLPTSAQRASHVKGTHCYQPTTSQIPFFLSSFPDQSSLKCPPATKSAARA